MWEQVQSGNTVSIWTICAGAPSAGDLSPFAQGLHARWEAAQNATTGRRAEDLNSCYHLGADSRYFSIPDCIYRRDPQTGEFLYSSESALYGPLQPGDSHIITALQEDLKRFIQPDMVIVSPLGLGSHVDHQLTRLALERLGCVSWYYADYPYVLNNRAQVDDMEQQGWTNQVFPISPEGLAAWQDSIAAHGSQISTFWSSENAMRQAVAAYLQADNGIRLWKQPGL